MPVDIKKHHLKKISEKENGLYASIVKFILNIKAKQVHKWIGPYIVGKKFLDIGVGIGGLNSFYRKQGLDVKGIDVKDLSIIEESTPTIYNGSDIPFGNDEFDTAIIVHVLHHCEDGIKVLAEALRVAKRVIVVDDTYRSDMEHKIVSFNDKIANSEYFEHQYHTRDEWLKIIKDKGWKLIDMQEYSDVTYFISYSRYVQFVIEK